MSNMLLKFTEFLIISKMKAKLLFLSHLYLLLFKIKLFKQSRHLIQICHGGIKVQSSTIPVWSLKDPSSHGNMLEKTQTWIWSNVERV